MTPERWRQVEQVYQAVVGRPAAERAPALGALCAADDDLRREVESLLAQGAASAFLETPAVVDLANDGLHVGQRVGPYVVGGSLGSGGMGEVYRARDEQLGREVALKILPDAFRTDPERRARLEREARVLAALNHPHIGAIHGLVDLPPVSGSDAAPARALVLELVDGPTLAERLAHGPLTLTESLTLALQIAEALEAAHETGIVHRDLKPANIKVTPSGAVKVLDFGLAKLTGAAASAHGDRAPTITADGTKPGLIVGTAAYMSPEQARGLPVDKRTDIWAFGCVLYEMLTGRRAFEGEDNSAVLARVLERDPDLTVLPAATPPAIRRLLRRCLEKDRKRRLPDIAAARLEIEDGLAELAVPAAPGTGPSPILKPRRSRWIGWSAAALVLLTTLGAAAAVYLARPAPDTRVYRSTFVPPAPLANLPGGRLALSPDGRRLAFTAPGPDGRVLLWVRTLDALTAQPLAGTEDALSPFWSPDSRFLGFVADRKLKKIDASGGPVFTLSEPAGGSPGAWNRDDVVLFNRKLSETGSSPIFRVAASGGDSSPATVFEAGDTVHTFPSFLPDGQHYLYVRGSSGGIGTYVGSLDSPDRIRLFDGWTNVRYASGHLLYVRGTTLVAQPFDATRLTLRGPPVPLAEHLQVTGGYDIGAFSVSETGVLVYQASTTGVEESRLIWFDRAGHEIGVLGDRAAYAERVSLSPSGRQAAVPVADLSAPNPRNLPRYHLWLFDIARGVRTRFTFDPAITGSWSAALVPIWSPDSNRVVFASSRKGPFDLYQKAASGAGVEELLLGDGVNNAPGSWSPDGRYLLYTRGTPQGEVWVLPLFGDRKPFPFIQSGFDVFWPQFSPDGRWVAYESNESGRPEVYVTPFPGPGGKWQVSTAGGMEPRWRHDGREIFFLAGTPAALRQRRAANKLMAAEVRVGGASFEVGAIQPLFDVRPAQGDGVYDVSADGRFLINTAEEQTPPITIVVNWPALRRK